MSDSEQQEPPGGSTDHLSVMSLKSNMSKDPPLFFRKQTTAVLQMSDSEQQEPPGGSTDPPSVMSLKSNMSKDPPLVFRKQTTTSSRSGASGLSLKSDQSKSRPPEFQEPGPEPQDERPEGPGAQYDLDAVFRHLQENILNFVKEELRRLHTLLASEQSGRSSESEEHGRSEAVLNITMDFLKRMDLEQLAQRLQKRHIFQFQSKLKSHLQCKFRDHYEGVAKAGDHTPLKQIYTELYITEGGSSQVNQEHEVRHMEMASRKLAAPEIIITCEEMFKKRPDSEEPIRAVLTQGVAGVGKTVLTQKFCLDWAEGTGHQDVQLLFPFTFRELNVLRDREFSLMELLHHFFTGTKGMCSFRHLQVLFIFDGLDECRLSLDFNGARVLTEPTESAPLEELLVNLIRGDLLPFARVWITTRPAAANQIPAECVSLVTEVRGFTDPQKEQYFRKRFRVKITTVLSHIKNIRSLYIMCYIPIFCWILSEVIKMILEQTEKPELPRTLTEMYIHFLVVQAKIKNIKFHEGIGADLPWTPKTKEMVNTLGKLAFEQLQKGNLIFYESDLSECGLDAKDIACYSGVFTQVFREEQGLYQDKVYSFIHLSVQEFLAALHVHQTFFSSGKNLLKSEDSESTTNTSTVRSPLSFFMRQREPTAEEMFYRSAVDQALQSPNGHLDLFLRFLLGLSLPTNQKLLPGLLTETGNDQTNQETVKYIKQKLNDESLSVERNLNLFHCLNELNDLSLMETIQQNMREGALSDTNMSPAHWSALSFVLLSSKSDLEEFDLRKYCPTEKGLLGLLPVIKASTKAILSGCNLTQNICAPLASVLSSSSLTEIDLSNNDLQDSGVELLCEELKSSLCKLETLKLSGCLVSERGGASLASALSSSHLRDLDLSYNNLGASAELLSALQAPHGPLQTLSLYPDGRKWMVPGPRKYYCDVTLDPNKAHRQLRLSEDNRSVSRGDSIVSSVGTLLLFPLYHDKFSNCRQVLSSSGLRGRCYWEVQWKGWEIDIAVSSREMVKQSGVSGLFGSNDQSWTMRIKNGQYFLHNDREKLELLSLMTPVEGFFVPSGRVGVFLDSKNGALSFYKVGSDGALFHLHTFFCSFTEPLFPGFGLWWEPSLFSSASVSLVKVNNSPSDR